MNNLQVESFSERLLAGVVRAVYKGADYDAEFDLYARKGLNAGMSYAQLRASAEYFTEHFNDAMEEHEEWLEYMQDMQEY